MYDEMHYETVLLEKYIALIHRERHLVLCPSSRDHAFAIVPRRITSKREIDAGGSNLRS